MHVQWCAATAKGPFYLKFYCLLVSAPRASRIIEISAKGSKRCLQILLPYCNLQPLHPFLMSGCFLHHHRAFTIMTENDEARGRGLQSWSNPMIAQLITWNKTHCASLLLWEKMMKHKLSSHHSAVWFKEKRDTTWWLKKKVLDCATEIAPLFQYSITDQF